MPWDRDEPHALLREWAEAHDLRGEGRRAVVVGCGLGADAEYLSRLGFATTGFDIAATAVRLARERHPGTLRRLPGRRPARPARASGAGPSTSSSRSSRSRRCPTRRAAAAIAGGRRAWSPPAAPCSRSRSGTPTATTAGRAAVPADPRGDGQPRRRRPHAWCGPRSWTVRCGGWSTTADPAAYDGLGRREHQAERRRAPTTPTAAPPAASSPVPSSGATTGGDTPARPYVARYPPRDPSGPAPPRRCTPGRAAPGHRGSTATVATTNAGSRVRAARS